MHIPPVPICAGQRFRETRYKFWLNKRSDRFAFRALIFAELNDECSARGKIRAERQSILYWNSTHTHAHIHIHIYIYRADEINQFAAPPPSRWKKKLCFITVCGAIMALAELEHNFKGSCFIELYHRFIVTTFFPLFSIIRSRLFVY